MRTLIALSAVLTLMLSCSGGSGGGAGSGNGSGAGNTPRYSVGGGLSGLTGTVTLQNNGVDDLSIVTNGQFTFPSSLTEGAAYEVTVKTQPPGQLCTVVNGTGTISGANVTSVTVTCNAVMNYSVGGSLTGFSQTVVLQNNGVDDLSIVTNGPFTFSSSLADGAAYEVTVKTQPPGQICIVGNGTGTISGANVTNVTVTCNTAYSVGGVLSGLTGTVTLQNNGTDDLTIGTTTGSFNFSALVADGASYQVTVKTQPPNQVCTVGNGAGLISGASVTNVTVTCEAALAWDAPVSDIDGSPVTGVAGYRIYYGTSPGVYTGSIDVGSTPRYAIADFSAAVPPGAYYISVTAYDADGTTESSFSNEITMTNN